MIKTGIIGATGYAGKELVQLLYHHTQAELVFLSSNSYHGKAFSDIYPHFKGFIDDTLIHPQAAIENFKKIDILFTALPHGTSFNYVTEAIAAGIKVVDLGADFRLHDQQVFEDWYKTSHTAPNLLDKAVYGLPELRKTSIKDAQVIANPGCYTTASILALAPALNHKIIDPNSIIVDAKSGATGAGRKPNVSLLLTECNESIKAYGIASHRHTPEIEQELSLVHGSSIKISFTPHLVPMERGILATCYGFLSQDITLEALYKIYKEFYKDQPFIRIREDLLETRFVKNTNLCDISIRVDQRTNRVIITSALDNLIKGASGQAVQNMNILFGLDEKHGLL